MRRRVPVAPNRRWMMEALALVLLTGIQGCATPGGVTKTARPAVDSRSRPAAAGLVRQKTTDVEQQRLDAIYDQAIYKSAVFHSDHKDGNLRRVTGPTVMGSFISCYRCDCPSCGTCSSKCLDPGVQKAPSDIWVSFTDQILEFCRQFPQDELILRMQQLQGLPPVRQPRESWKFLVVKVKGPEQLFRPCADPDPATSGPCDEQFPHGTSLEHQSWIANQALSSYQVPDGYPWTRLGYTYNWNPDAGSIVGTSEFVIPAGTEVAVLELVEATKFCASN